MDLLQTVRKEGSRGGRAEFKWEDVKSDQHRENYLGHSLMAPVGRWQKGRDLNWYAKADDAEKLSAAEKLVEEKRKLKEAEEDAMLLAMGLPVPDRASRNANLEPLGQKASDAGVKRALAETAGDDDEEEVGKSNALSHYTGGNGVPANGDGDVLEGHDYDAPQRGRKREDRPRDHRSKDVRDREDGDRRRRRSRSASRDRHSKRRDRSRSPGRRRHREHDRHRDRSRSRDHRRRDDRHRDRSRSRDRRRRDDRHRDDRANVPKDERRRSPSRSRTPDPRRRDDKYRDDRNREPRDERRRSRSRSRARRHRSQEHELRRSRRD